MVGKVRTRARPYAQVFRACALRMRDSGVCVSVCDCVRVRASACVQRADVGCAVDWRNLRIFTAQNFLSGPGSPVSPLVSAGSSVCVCVCFGRFSLACWHMADTIVALSHVCTVADAISSIPRNVRANAPLIADCAVDARNTHLGFPFSNNSPGRMRIAQCART